MGSLPAHSQAKVISAHLLRSLRFDILHFSRRPFTFSSHVCCYVAASCCTAAASCLCPARIPRCSRGSLQRSCLSATLESPNQSVCRSCRTVCRSVHQG